MAQMFSIQDANGALALIRALKDPGSETVLADIISRETALAEMRKSVDTRADVLNAQAKDLGARESTLIQALDKFENEKSMADKSIAARTADVAQRELVFGASSVAESDRLAKLAAAVKDREDAVATAVSALRSREAAVAVREAEIGPREVAADAKAAEATATVAKFRALLPPE